MNTTAIPRHRRIPGSIISPGVPVQQLVRNQFGASIGGPIKKDRSLLLRQLGAAHRFEQRGPGASRAFGDPQSKASYKVQLTDGSVQTILPSQLPQIDPLGIGLNTPYQKILNQYPVGNDPAYGQDGGLNFSGFRFNAPDHLNEWRGW